MVLSSSSSSSPGWPCWLVAWYTTSAAAAALLLLPAASSTAWIASFPSPPLRLARRSSSSCHPLHLFRKNDDDEDGFPLPPHGVLSALRHHLTTTAVDRQRRRPRTRRRTQSRHRLLLHSKADDAEEDDDEDEEDDDDADEPNEVDIANFRPPSTSTSYGWNRGRSPPTTRKALGGKNGANDRVVSYLCTNCGSEFVKWFGKCPTCREWNTLQAHTSPRRASSVSTPPPRSLGDFSPAFLSRSNNSNNNTGGSSSSGGWVGPTSTSFGTTAYNNYDNNNNNMNNNPVRITDVDLEAPESARLVIPNDDEFNLIMGGGITPGSLTLLGGEPGVGKSTLVLQIACALATKSLINDINNNIMGPVWYVSGEETPHQIAQRAKRLQSRTPQLYLLQETHVDSLCQQVIAYQNNNNNHQHHWPNNNNGNGDNNAGPPPPAPQHLGLLIIDSIQTMHCDAAGGGMTGGVAQVRESVALLLRLAKLSAIPILLIGHVTKSGDLAGPRTVEHMVDTVLYLEQQSSSSSSNNNNIRLLRASKNRFGSTDEVGVYEMTAGRLVPVLDASALFLATRNELNDEEGCAIAMYVT
jgi:DNA repair protein RadA/Sms